MSDPFRMYEAARKHMYTAMERESDPPTAIRGYQQALDGFAQFLAAAAKNRGMYKELVGHHPLAWQLPCPAFCFRVRPSLCLLDASPPPHPLPLLRPHKGRASALGSSPALPTLRREL